MRIREYLKDNDTGEIIDYIPDECPVCHKGIEPKRIMSALKGQKDIGIEILQVIYQCPRRNCNSYYIVYYRKSDWDRPGDNFEEFVCQTATPIEIIEQTFSDDIINISPKFSEIYNQSLVAEKYGLLEVCGAGYRRSLEFLIKDYLISLVETEEKKKIINDSLGNCIQKYINDTDIQQLSLRAKILGNDETHYYKEYIEYDIQDLKELILLTQKYIDNNIKAKKYLDGIKPKTK